MRIAIVLALLAGLADSRQAFDPDLTDQRCRGAVLLTELDGVRMRGTCVVSGDVREIHISIENTAAEEVGPLRHFSLGFCDSAVLEVTAPEGWVASARIPGGTAAWDKGNESVGLRTGGTLAGFVVKLKAGWRRSRSAQATWDSTAIGTLTTHDCFDGAAH